MNDMMDEEEENMDDEMMEWSHSYFANYLLFKLILIFIRRI